jgi:CRISPR-associated RAMP protein (TIGR02581 family)
MFKKLVNEAILSFSLATDGPLLINSGESAKIDPSLPDMRFVRCQHNGKETVYLPGSSLKGVFRARYEQLTAMLEVKPSSTADASNKSNKKEKTGKHEDGLTRYLKEGNKSIANRLFGSLEIGSRVSFSDAYPDGKVSLGKRTGVGIDRITGAAKGGALFDYEVVEQGTFKTELRLTNFALYQLGLILWILQDVDDGLVTFGMGGSRGNGRMRIENTQSVELRYRYYGKTDQLRGYFDGDTGKALDGSASRHTLFATEYVIRGFEAIANSIELSSQKDLSRAIADEAKNLLEQKQEED